MPRLSGLVKTAATTKVAMRCRVNRTRGWHPSTIVKLLPRKLMVPFSWMLGASNAYTHLSGWSYGFRYWRRSKGVRILRGRLACIGLLRTLRTRLFRYAIQSPRSEEFHCSELGPGGLPMEQINVIGRCNTGTTHSKLSVICGFASNRCYLPKVFHHRIGPPKGGAKKKSERGVFLLWLVVERLASVGAGLELSF